VLYLNCSDLVCVAVSLTTLHSSVSLFWLPCYDLWGFMGLESGSITASHQASNKEIQTIAVWMVCILIYQVLV